MSDPHDFGPLSAGSTATDSGAGAEADLEAARLGVLLEIACDAVVAVDQDGVIVLVNERAEQMFGFARTELIGSLVEVLVPSHARASYVLERVAYVADPRPRRLEVTAARRDGSEFPVEITLNTLATAGGFLVVAAVREITERRLLDARSARLSAIVGSSRESIIAVSLNGVVTDWSAGAERMYGYSAAEAIGMPISLTHASAEQHELLGWILQRVAAGGSVDDLEMTHLAKDGRVICVSLSAWPVHDGHGRVVGASMIVRDITERMQAAVALVEAQDRFRYTFEDSPVGMAMLDLEFRYAQVNDAYCRLVGYTREQLLGTSVAAITHPEDIERDLDGMRATLHGSQGVYRAEKRYIHASGETIHVTLHAVLLRSREGAPLGFLSHAQDTTDHKRHERALHEELALLRSLLMEAVHAVVIVDQSGEIVLVNIAAEAMFGYRQEELVGEQVEILVPERFCESHEGERERFATGASTRAMGIGVELLARRKDGTEFPVEIGLSRVATGRGTLISAAISDVTERERLDAEVAALAALVTSSDDAIIGKRLDGTITSWNPAAQRMYGHSAAEAVGRHIRMLCPSREQEHELDRVLGRVAAGEEVDHFETRRRRKNGGVIDVSVTISPIRNARGDVVGASTAARDISERKRAAAALSEAEERFRGAFEEAPIGMVMLTERMAVARVNAAMCRLLDRTEKEVVGRSILEFTHPDDVQHSIEWNDAKIAGDVIPPLIKRYVRPDGSIREVQVTTALIEPPGSARYFFSQCEDVTARRRGERQKAAIADLGHRALQDGDVVALMGEAVRMIRQILATSVCIVSRCSGDGAVRLVAAHGESLGWTIGPGHPTQAAYTLALGKPVVSDDLLRETRFSAPPSVLERGMRRSLSVPVPDRSGARLVILTHGPASIAPLTIDDVRFVEMVAHVIAGALDRAASEDELRRRALEDPLTGLANRALLFSQLDAELRHARRLGNRVCVLVLDLDRFKTVNDTLGHSAGDTLLRQVAARLTACVREEDLVARPGGDEFTVLCTRTASDGAISEVAQRLVDAVIEPFELDRREVFLTGSLGVAVSQHGTETAEELLRDADAAMYRAKERGGSRFEIFDVALRQHLIARMAIEGDLRHALERDELELYYQPVVDLADQRVVGFEALLRWRHPARGVIAPDQFIQIAEETGLIVPIGSWVLHEVCAQLANWPEQIQASVNLSALQITPQLVAEVERQLAQHHLTPGRLVLEITESLVLDPAVKPVVSSLRTLGAKLALDDFGTGYSSLGSLQRFPLDVLKLDRTLIDSLTEDSGVAVVRAAVELGRALGVSVVAEGIETEAQLAVLRELRCPLGQGYLFAKPLPLPDAQNLITKPDQPHNQINNRPHTPRATPDTRQ